MPVSGLERERKNARDVGRLAGLSARGNEAQFARTMGMLDAIAADPRQSIRRRRRSASFAVGFVVGFTS